ncbi:alpha-glucosidase [Fodinisporobacter ferrooxydans]|uniref:Alpha-glucosidase n=1 Tax=Fodinisporobacter ferrooxydans TaxID=2901836 RepID=A0ABY4CIU9_9BACL|nr:alpha-glucosidase [Alicyclobacillaceae bacterium MYW30-H2]
MSIFAKTTNTFALKSLADGFEIALNGMPILRHTMDQPMVFVGIGAETINMHRGNFDIQDYLIERVALRYAKIDENGDSYVVRLSKYAESEPSIVFSIKEENKRLKLELIQSDETINRFWFRVTADQNEKVYGCGEQLSYFNLRGKHFPLWTSEPGVGRNKKTYVTWQADVNDHAGGDYYTTNFPLPTYVSSKKYYCHVDTTAYADFDFRNDEFHELQVWDVPQSIVFEAADSFLELVEKITERFGRQPELPEWTYNGIWLGIQGGTDVVEEKLQRALDKGVKVGGVWCQDWQGKRITSFGKRLMWNWKWNPEEYPNLDQKMKEWKEKGIRFLGYINPYVAIEGDLYKTASEKGYLALNKQGEDYLVDFGEFYCGVVDFTNPEACKWYKSVIKNNLIDFGLDGWMADFGEYLPTDVVLKSGASAKIMHNAWPVLWAKMNYEAVREAGKLGEVVYFMRAGFTGTQKYCTLLWAGDQSVDWSLDDGLASVIPAALSSGIIGCGLHHSDIGGYTSLHGNKRTKELFMRWAEMSTFTPVMRTHEGNRPYDCFQFDSDDETLEHLARMTNIYVALAPYTKHLVKINAEKGIPVQRPLFMHYENDEEAYKLQYQYLYGRDLLVAPVHQESQQTWNVYLPEDQWIHLWTGQKYKGGYSEVDVPLGYPAVFYREDSDFVELFREISNL